jgi:DNA segregation ATPase FtsK/SpoIIIE, S-DNA-T family
MPRDNGRPDPEIALWAALSDSDAEGVSVAELVRTTGKGRTWVYDRLHQWAETGRMPQTARGRWRAIPGHLL